MKRLLFVLFFVFAAGRASFAVAPGSLRLEREIIEYPGYGAFQNIRAVSVDELRDGLIVLAGTPPAVHVFDLNTGASMLRVEIPISNKAKAVAVWRCGGPVVVMYNDQDGVHVTAVGEDGGIIKDYKPPETVPELTNRTVCTAAGALFAMSEERSEAALIDIKGGLLFKISGRKKEKKSDKEKNQNRRNLLRSAAATSMGDLYALDGTTGLVAMYDRKGALRGTVAPGPDEYGRTPADPALLAADTFGNFLIYDRALLCILSYDSFGAYKTTYYNTGEYGFQFLDPVWMYLTRWKRLVLWDHGTESIRIFDLNE